MDKDPNKLIEVPKGGNCANILKLVGGKVIGDGINKVIATLFRCSRPPRLHEQLVITTIAANHPVLQRKPIVVDRTQ